MLVIIPAIVRKGYGEQLGQCRFALGIDQFSGSGLTLRDFSSGFRQARRVGRLPEEIGSFFEGVKLRGGHEEG